MVDAILGLTDYMHCLHDLSLEPKPLPRNVMLLTYLRRCTLNAHNSPQVGFLYQLKVQLCKTFLTNWTELGLTIIDLDPLSTNACNYAC